MGTIRLAVTVFAILLLGCGGLIAERLPLQAEQLILAGAWQDGEETIYIDATGNICIEVQSARTSSFWSGKITEITGEVVVAQSLLASRTFKIDRMPWEEGGVSRVGIDGRTWRLVANSGGVTISQIGSATSVNTGVVERNTCLDPKSTSAGAPAAAPG